jgi:glyoxylase-like metal-dependent hydrolase (beta-lactamase superfamily II)
MADAAHPTPAELPLPGGREGATVRVHPLLSGTATWPDAWPHKAEGRLARLRAMGIGVPSDEWVELPIVAFLVEHPGAGAILIDAGLDPLVADDPKAGFGRVLAATGARTVKMEPSQAIPPQLRERGVDPAAVKLAIMTHLHYDHASGLSQFPEAKVLATTAEFDAANGFMPVLHGYARKHFRNAKLSTVDFGASKVDSYSTFGRSLDLLGDGSIRLVFTPGHTHGHMSVVLRTAGREVLVAGDAVYTRRTLETGHLPGYVEDEHVFTRSLREIQLYARENPDALVIPGHDMEAWRQLDPLYE